MTLKYITKSLHKPSKRVIRSCFYTSSLLFGLSFIFLKFEISALLGLLLFIYYISHLLVFRKKVLILDFYINGFIICGFAFSFLFDMAPQNWAISLPSWYVIVSQLSAWLVVVSICAVLYILLGLGLHKITSRSWRLASLVVLLPITEVLRSYLFAFVSYGPGGSLSPNFNWGSLGIVASGTPLVFAARLVGFFGLTALMVITCLSLFLILQRKVVIGCGLVLLVVCFTFIGWQQGNAPNTKSLSIVLVHLNEQDAMDYWQDWNSIPQNTDILVLPEYSGALDNPQFHQLASKLSPDGVGITSRMSGVSPHGKNQIVYFNKEGKFLSIQDKTFLIPSGEYMPYSLMTISKFFGQQRVLDSFKKSQQLVPGTLAETPVTNNQLHIGALVCSGVMALNEYSRLSRSGADVLVNSASLSFLTPHSRYHVAARNMARYQAVQNTKPFIQASRSGQSLVITKQGQFITAYNNAPTKVISARVSF